jgi:tRNA/tmRNA/rRNA uracil-C5-methylase (TrmA/RlmC/RlmD family)
VKKQIIQQISVTGISAEGFGIGKLEDGKVVFVPYTAIGDEAVVKVTKSKKSYAEGTLLELVKPSADRRTPACSPLWFMWRLQNPTHSLCPTTAHQIANCVRCF